MQKRAKKNIYIYIIILSIIIYPQFSPFKDWIDLKMSISRQLPQPDPFPRPATSPVDNRLFFGSSRFHLMIHEAGTQHTETSGLERTDAQHSHFLETHGLKKCTVIVTGDFPNGRIMLQPTCANSAHL